MDDITKKLMEGTDSVPKQRKRKRKKKYLKILVCTVMFSMLLLTYLSSVYYFSEHLFYKTRINGVDCSFLEETEVKQRLGEKVSDYRLEIIGKDNVTDTITAKEIGLELVYEEALQQVREEENPFLWLSAFFKGYDYELQHMAEYEEDLLEEKIKNLNFYNSANSKTAKNAYIGNYDEQTGKFVIVPEEEGTQLDTEKLRLVLSGKIKGLQEVVYLELEDCYKKADILSDNKELQKELEALNACIGAKITYDWNGTAEIVDGRLIAEWLVKDGETYILDEEKVAEFIKEKAKEHDTYGKDRTFTATDGRSMTLKSGGYGWKTARDEETAALIAAIKSGEAVEKEPAYSSRGAQKGKDDIGSSYVEIDLGTQHLYLYVEGVIVLESDFVSGNVSSGWTTPPGVFGLTYKTKNAVLRGETYETPVNYWMPFNGNIGMHDATWRGSFGGDIYLTNGSHGCINLPLEAASQIYEYISTGFPVVCYY